MTHKPRSAPSRQAATSSAALERALWVERNVALDVCAWLDMGSTGRQHRIAGDIQRRLSDALRVARAALTPVGNSNKKVTRSRRVDWIQRQLVLEINSCSSELVERAESAISLASKAGVIYVVCAPKEEVIEDDVFEFKFDELPFLGDPVTALQNMLDLRQAPPGDQLSALALLNATEDETLASQSVAAATSFGDRPVLPLQRELERARRRLKVARSTTPAEVQTLATHAKLCLQFSAQGSFPLAVALPQDASSVDCVIAASAYENLARQLRMPLQWSIAGERADRLHASGAWAIYEACGVGCKVIAAWLRTLGSLTRPEKCEFCYRHRGKRLRCAEHASTVNESPGTRLGRAVNPLFVERAISLAKLPDVRAALKSSLWIHDATWEPVASEARKDDVPSELLRNVAILAVQLRRLRPLFGPTLETKAANLFGTMVSEVSAVYQTVYHRTTESARWQRRQRAEAPYLLTLSGFLRLWYGTALPAESSFCTLLTGLGQDIEHPVVKSGAVNYDAVAPDLLQQRAWSESCIEHAARTTPFDRTRILELAGKLSWRAIAREVGCSPETARRIAKNVQPTGKRKYTRLKPLRALSR